MRSRCVWAGVLLAVAGSPLPAQDAAGLRLVPFPKQIVLGEGSFPLGRDLFVETSAADPRFLAGRIGGELRRAGFREPAARGARREGHVLRLVAVPDAPWPGLAFRDGATPEDYTLEVRPDAVLCAAPGEAGLFYAVQTLCQLIRANRRGDAIPALSVNDWPSLRWRCFQDDMTRGPSSKPETLHMEVALGAALKLNLFTYYMEYQYAFQKHPLMGPQDGSLTPETLRQLVDFARPYHVDILGNQQSFGHFERILRHETYAHLRETPSVLCPVREETYQLLDDLYSEVCPHLPFPWFNVCCDETWGLGTGPSKDLAAKIGTGGVYVQHIRRVHDLLQQKHKKRMMMWGDIILQHPDRLGEIPKDTIMLTWGYADRPSFEDQILPFARSGYEFFVCPGVSNWNRILPDFGVATTNIRHFVRDGAKHGAIGMLNTSWEDDGEALNSINWHGYAWGAECAWNASVTDPGVFNRRVGAVLFGEPGDHFGQAIELLARTHRLPGMLGMNNKRFWEDDFPPRTKPAAARESAKRLLEIVRPAIEHLEACQQQATANAELLDAFLFGARRMEFIGQRMLDGLEVAERYAKACESPAEKAVPMLAKVEEILRKQHERYRSFARQFQDLWLKESKPYALDWTMKRYDEAVKKYDAWAGQIAQLRRQAEAGKPLPPPEKVGLALADSYSRRTRPQRIEQAPLDPSAAWAEAGASHRLGLSVNAGSADRRDLPLELDVELAAPLAQRPVRAFRLQENGPPQEILGQLDPSGQEGRTRLTLFIPGHLPKGSSAKLHVYLGLAKAPHPLPTAAITREATGGAKWLENDKVRLLLGPEGAHVYRWEVKSRENLDLTMPGEQDWAGFCDVGGVHRRAVNTLKCTARGPALVRYECSDPTGLKKTISLFGGVSWMEVDLNEGVEYYWDFDNPANFAAEGPSPGTYLFSNGATGPVGRHADGVAAQVRAGNVYWGVKFNPQQLALGLATPETAASHCVAPGAGAGGVGIERSNPAGHFVTFAGLMDAPPRDTMQRLAQTLDFRNQPDVRMYAIQPRP